MTISLSLAALLAAFFGSASPPPVTPEFATPAAGEPLDFGGDWGEFPNDGECDDPRFTGAGMAASLDLSNVGGDASDCRRQFEAGSIRHVRAREETSVAECTAIDFGDDSSTWANDGECDDPRFTGPGIHSIANPEDLRADATDCRALCGAGDIWLK